MCSTPITSVRGVLLIAAATDGLKAVTATPRRATARTRRSSLEAWGLLQFPTELPSTCPGLKQSAPRIAHSAGARTRSRQPAWATGESGHPCACTVAGRSEARVSGGRTRALAAHG